MAAGRSNNGGQANRGNKYPPNQTSPLNDRIGTYTNPAPSSTQTPKQAIERQVELNIKARAILNQFALESLNVEPYLELTCVPYKDARSAQLKRIGWNFYGQGKLRAIIRVSDNDKFVVKTIANDWETPNLDRAFKLVRESVAQRYKVNKKEVAIKWGDDNRQTRQKIVVEIVPSKQVEFDGERSKGENFDIKVFEISYGNLYLRPDSSVKITFNDKMQIFVNNATNLKKKFELPNVREAKQFLREAFAQHLGIPENDIEIKLPYREPKHHQKFEKQRKKEKIKPRHLENLKNSIKIESIEQLLGNEFNIPKKKKNSQGELLGANQEQLYNDLDEHEQLFVDELREAGIDVNLIEMEDYPTPDFVLNDAVTGEVKAIFEYNLGDIIARMEHGIEKQLANRKNKVLFVDTRYGALNDNQVNEIHRKIEESCDRRCLIVYIMKDRIVRRILNG